MAANDQWITDLPEATTMADEDVFTVVDVSAIGGPPDDSPEGGSRKITKINVKNSIQEVVVFTTQTDVSTALSNNTLTTIGIGIGPNTSFATISSSIITFLQTARINVRMAYNLSNGSTGLAQQYSFSMIPLLDQGLPGESYIAEPEGFPTSHNIRTQFDGRYSVHRTFKMNVVPGNTLSMTGFFSGSGTDPLFGTSSLLLSVIPDPAFTQIIPASFVQISV